MGKGNVCTHNKCEGLFYINYEDLLVYRYKDRYKDSNYEPVLLKTIQGTGKIDDYEFDEHSTSENIDDVLEMFVADLTAKQYRFSSCDKWLSNTENAIAEDEFFYIAIEDNDWSIAVKLLQKEAPEHYDDEEIDAFEMTQERLFQSYLTDIRDALFEQFDELGIYAGPWTHGLIRKGEC